MAGQGEPLRFYPQGYLSIGNGDLRQVTDFSVQITNNAKVEHTIRQEGAGISAGKTSAQVSYNASVDEDGMERDYRSLVKNKTIKQIRFKAPGGDTWAMTGVFTSVTASVDETMTKLAVQFVGRVED